MTLRSTASRYRAQPISPISQSYTVGRDCDRRAASDGVGGKGDEVLVDDIVESEEIIEAAEVDADPIKVAPSPYTPTQQEVDEHYVDHVPPRSWCVHCANGFGREDAHHSESTSRTLPVISFDYMFLTRKGIYLRG